MIDTTSGTAKPRVTLCSTVSEASGEDPAGSAWAVRRIILFELPLPWPYDVLSGKRVPAGLRELMYELYERLPEPWGMTGIAPDSDYSVEGMTRMLDLQQGDGIATAYRRDEYLVPNDEVVETLRRLSYEPDHPRLTELRQPDDQETREFFICTHGAVDACCATMGYPIYKLMRAMAAQAERPTRVWRCTHFGGHRFAATALEAPQGRYWGHLKAEMLSSLVHQSATPRDLRRHYRGWAAIAEPLWQVAEAELFATAGWSWTNATITDISGGVASEAGGTLTVAFRHPLVERGEVEIAISPTGVVKTMESTNDPELVDAPQYTARITSQRPDGCLAMIDRSDGRD